jgi:pyrimidine operon attenuation protein/uracil phosphoribosyltransferase
MEKQVILNATQLELTLKRLSHELIETHDTFENSVLIGLQPRGIHVTTRIKAQLEAI